MTTPRIEEMVEELFQYYDDIDCAVTVDQRITAKEQAELWLKRTLTQAHQAGIDEAVKIVENMEITKKVIYKAEGDYERGMKIGYNDGIYRAKRDAIKALQDNK